MIFGESSITLKREAIASSQQLPKLIGTSISVKVCGVVSGTYQNNV
jgi:hypothetical protein